MRVLHRLPLLFLFVLPVTGGAQTAISIVDSATGRGLPFATISCAERRWGRVTDSTGSADIPDSLLGATCACSFVGFRTRTVTLSAPGRITLAQRPLPDVRVNACRFVVPLNTGSGPTTKGSGIRWAFPKDGAMMAVWVPNPSGKPGRVQTLSYYVQKWSNTKRYEGRPDAPVRLRFFDRGPEGFPGEELTYEDIRVAATRFGRFSVDLSGYRILLPEAGVFVAFEFFEAGSQYWHQVRFDGPPPPKAITQVYGFGFGAHPATSVPMYFRSPVFPDWRIMSGSQELAVDIGAEVCK